MRKMKISYYLGVAALAVGSMVFMAACHKKDTNTATEDTGYASDHMLAEKSYSDVQSITDQAANTASGSTLSYRLTSSACATVTHTGDSIIVDFSSTDCLCNDGRTRRGKIICVYTGGAYADSGSVHYITFDNYYQDDNNIAGTKTVTNLGHNSAGQPIFNVVIAGTITKASGGVITANWTRLRTWTAGYLTPTDHTDDAYSISGTGTIVRATGATVAVSIPTTAPLQVAYGCRWIEAGTINYTLPSGLTRSINFGNTPVCNNTATITLPSGATYNITMP